MKSGEFMFTGRRRGVIGFMLTMAVGIALGAAALVVTSEMKRENPEENKPAVEKKMYGSPAMVEKAFEEYQKAYKDYQMAVGMGRADMKKYEDLFKAARRRLELEIFRNTPGVSEMDLSGIDDTATGSHAIGE